MNNANSTHSNPVRWVLIVFGAVIGGSVLVGALSSHLFSTGPSAPKRTRRSNVAEISKKWEFDTSAPTIGALALGTDGTIYAAGQDGFLYAIDSNGKLKWKFNAGPMVSAPVLDATGTIYITNEEERIFAVDGNGNQVWANGAVLMPTSRSGL